MTLNNNDNNTHDLTIGHCNIQGGLTGIGKTTEIMQLIKKHNLDIFNFRTHIAKLQINETSK